MNVYTSGHIHLPTCQCEVEPIIRAFYPRATADYLLMTWRKIASDMNEHFQFEEMYIFPHLIAEDRRRLTVSHERMRTLAGLNQLRQQDVDLHAQDENAAIERALRPA